MSRSVIFLLIITISLILASGTALAYPNVCPVGIYSGDRVVIAAWAYKEAHVSGYSYNWVAVSVPGKSNSLTGLGGDYHLVSNFICFRYGVEGYATYSNFSSSRPSLQVSYTPSNDTNHLESISASATGGYIRFRVVGTTSRGYGFGWASISYAVTIHSNGGPGGGSTSPAGTAIYLAPRGLPEWLYNALISNAAGWEVKYALRGGYNGSGSYLYGGVSPSGLMASIPVDTGTSPVSLKVQHLGLHYSPEFAKSIYYWGSGKAVASVSKSASYTRLYMRAWYTGGPAGSRVYARAVFTLSDTHVEYGEVVGLFGSVAAYVSNGTGWERYTGGRVLAKKVMLKYYGSGSASGGVYVSNSLPVKPVAWTLTWNGSDPNRPSPNGTIVSESSGDAFRGNLTGNGAYTLIAYFAPRVEPLLPGVILLPGLEPGVHRITGGFHALLVNTSGATWLSRAQLPLEVDVPEGFTWHSMRCGAMRYITVNASSIGELPLAGGARLLALEAPSTLGPVELCVDANCTWYNVTRLVLAVETVEYNATHILIRLRPGYECCPHTPVREHLVYVLQLGNTTLESPRDTPAIAVPVSLLEQLGPAPLHAALYARYTPGARVPLQLASITILRGSVRLAAVQGSTLVFTEPYVWPAYYTSFTSQPWSGPPGTLWVRVGDGPWAMAEWNGTNFIYRYTGSLDGAEVEFYWAPPPTDKLVLPLVQRWILGRW